MLHAGLGSELKLIAGPWLSGRRRGRSPSSVLIFDYYESVMRTADVRLASIRSCNLKMCAKIEV